MKLIRFGDPGGEKPGVLLNDGTRIDVSGFGSDYNEEFFSMDGLDQLRDWLARDSVSAPRVPTSVRLGPPISRPSKIVCIGLNFHDHAAETGATIPKKPVIFFKSTSALVGPNDDLVIPKNATKAKSVALLALGYLAPTDNEAMTYLRASANLEVWEKRGVKWIGPYSPTKGERDSELSKHAILALGLSGNPSAAEFLVSLQRGEPIRLTPEFDDVIAQAIKTNEKVQRNGAAAYDRRR